MNKFEVVPELRFSGFNKAWTKKRLKEIGTFLGGGTPSKTNPDFWTGLIPWVSSSDITDDSIHQIKVTRFITEDAIAKSATKLVPENTILLVSRVGVGKLAVTTKTLCTSQDFANFTPSEGDVYFLAYYLKSKSTEFLKFNQGMAIQGFTKDDISNFVLYIPQDLEEQQKVADCLSSIDDLITKNTQKLEALKLHKKGLMQKLFPEEGKSAPELRFSGFNEGWKETKVENVCYLQAGKFVKAANIKSKENDRLYPCYGGNGLRGFTESFTHDGSYSLIGRQGALCGNVNFVTGRFHATEHAVVVEPKENVDNLWLYYELCRLNLNRFATGQAQPGLSVENLNRVDTFIPKLKNEQKKISESLFTIDELIKKQSKKVEVLKEYKKGLTQRLFPSNEGATV